MDIKGKRVKKQLFKTLYGRFYYNYYSSSSSDTPENKFYAPDGMEEDFFGFSCSMKDNLVVVGAPWTGDEFIGAAYLFEIDNDGKTAVIKKELTTPDTDGPALGRFGYTLSIDEKAVVGSSNGNYFSVFSLEGEYEKSVICDECSELNNVKTHGNKILSIGVKDSSMKLYIHSTDGELLKVLDEGDDYIAGIAISNDIIVSVTSTKTTVYSNSDDFQKISEIPLGHVNVAASGDRLVLGDFTADKMAGAAHLYKSDGTLIKTLDRNITSCKGRFGFSVDMTDDEKVIIGSIFDNDSGKEAGSVSIYSAITGEFEERRVASDAKDEDNFGHSVCTSGKLYVVGANGVDNRSGAAYLFQFSDDIVVKDDLIKLS